MRGYRRSVVDTLFVASMLQTKLKLGFARASRVMDELERYGLIGPQDPRNPASPRHIYGPDNWFKSLDDIDDPGDR